MTRSDLIARLAERHPQLLAKDAELAVKVIRISGCDVRYPIAWRADRSSWVR